MAVYKGNAAQSELSQGSNAFAEAYKGSQKLYSKTKSGGLPTGEFGQRIGDMCTVVGTTTNSTGQILAFALLDAQYRDKLGWGESWVETPLVNYGYEAAINDPNSATENTDIILNTYPDKTEYEAFIHCRNVASVEIDGIVYFPALPTAKEVKTICLYTYELDSLDPTSHMNYYSFWNSSNSSYRICKQSYLGICTSEENASFSYIYYDFQNDQFKGSTKTFPYVVLPVFEFPLAS